MMNRLLAAVLVFGACISPLAQAGAQTFADKQVLVELTNSMNREINYLNALFDRATAVPRGLNITVVNEAGQVASSTNFSLAQIASPEGAVIASSARRAAVIIRGPLDPKVGGTVTLKYLTNIVTGSYSECQAHVRKSGNTWQVVNTYTGAVVTHAHIQTWTLGISVLKGICPEPDKFDFMETP